MKRFKAFMAEVEKPKSELDKKVFAEHPKKVKEYPVADAGERDVKTTKDHSRPADKVTTTEGDSGEVHFQSGRAYSKAQIMQYFKPEQVENIDEVSKERIKAYLGKATSGDKSAASVGKKSAHKGNKRLDSTGKAFHKLDKLNREHVEEEKKTELTEISKKRLGDYIDAARDRVKSKTGESAQQQKNIDKAVHGINRAKHNYERGNQRAAAYQSSVKKEKIDAEIKKRKEGIMTAAKKFNKKKAGE